MKPRNEVREFWTREYRRIRCMARGLRGCHDKSLRHLWEDVKIYIPGHPRIDFCVRWSGERIGSPSYGMSCGRAYWMRDHRAMLADLAAAPLNRLVEPDVRRMMMQIVAIDRWVCPLPDRRVDFGRLRFSGMPITKGSSVRGPIEFMRLAQATTGSVLPDARSSRGRTA